MMIGHSPRMFLRLPREHQWNADTGSPAMPVTPFRGGLPSTPTKDDEGSRFREIPSGSVIGANPALSLSKLLWLAQVAPAKGTSGEDPAPNLGTTGPEVKPSDDADVAAIAPN